MTRSNDTLADYQKHVARLFDEGSSIFFTNKDREHAAILISTLFNKAQKEVVVLCRNFDSEFYGRPLVKKAVEDAVARKVNLRIKVQQEPEQTELLQWLTSTSRPNVEFKICAPGTQCAETPMNFTVADGKAFRLEKNRNLHEAIACANEPDVAKQILQVFDTID